MGDGITQLTSSVWQHPVASFHSGVGGLTLGGEWITSLASTINHRQFAGGGYACGRKLCDRHAKKNEDLSGHRGGEATLGS